MRDKFEIWAKDFVKGRDSNDRYTSPYTQAAWEGWQAALKNGVSADGIQVVLAENTALVPEHLPRLACLIAEAVETGNY